MSHSFAGRVALVTGAGSGIGLATAQAFGEAGASVVLADGREEAVRAAAGVPRHDQYADGAVTYRR